MTALPLRDFTDADWMRWSRHIDMTGGPESCWVWHGYRNADGYGMTSFQVAGKSRTVLAHRAVYKFLTGEQLTRDVFLLHSCDNPPCCNPAHLRPGTHRQNMADRMTRGAGYPRGASHHKWIKHLTEADAAEIRSAYQRRRNRLWGVGALATKYGVSQNVIKAIARREGRWAEAC